MPGDGIADRLAALERRVTLLEVRATVLRRTDNRRVLELLRNIAESPFNDGTLTMCPSEIGGALGQSSGDLALAISELRHAGFIESTHVDSTGHWRITEDGLWAMEKS